LRPEIERHSEKKFDTFGCFYFYSNTLQSVLAPEGQRLYSPVAELMNRQADREDIPFSAVIETELLILLMVFLNPDVRHWYPQTLHYSAYDKGFPFFIRATHSTSIS
jgi:hypothetical protein